MNSGHDERSNLGKAEGSQQSFDGEPDLSQAPTPQELFRKNLPLAQDMSAGLSTDVNADLLAGLLTSSAEDELPKKVQGPLDRPPSRASLYPALTLYLSFFLTSLIYWRSSWGQWLWVSQHAVFSDGEYWRLLTALFTHSDLGHWLSNGPLFLIFGWYLRAYFGRLAFPIAPLLAGVVTNLLTVAFYPPTTRLIGASGMLYAMVALWICFYIRFDAQHRPSLRFLRAIGFSLMVLFPTTFEPQTSYLAHSLGFGLGIITALCLLPCLAHSPRLKAAS